MSHPTPSLLVSFLLPLSSPSFPLQVPLPHPPLSFFSLSPLLSSLSVLSSSLTHRYVIRKYPSYHRRLVARAVRGLFLFDNSTVFDHEKRWGWGCVRMRIKTKSRAVLHCNYHLSIMYRIMLLCRFIECYSTVLTMLFFFLLHFKLISFWLDWHWLLALRHCSARLEHAGLSWAGHVTRELHTRQSREQDSYSSVWICHGHNHQINSPLPPVPCLKPSIQFTPSWPVHISDEGTKAEEATSAAPSNDTVRMED